MQGLGLKRRESAPLMVAFLMAMRVTSLWLLLRVPLLLLPLLSKLRLLLWHC